MNHYPLLQSEEWSFIFFILNSNYKVNEYKRIIEIHVIVFYKTAFSIETCFLTLYIGINLKLRIFIYFMISDNKIALISLFSF